MVTGLASRGPDGLRTEKADDVRRFSSGGDRDQIRNWEFRRCGRGGRSTLGPTWKSGGPAGASDSGADRAGDAAATGDTEAGGACGRSRALSTFGAQPDESFSAQQSIAGAEKAAGFSPGRAQQKSGSARRPPASRRSARAKPVRFTFVPQPYYAARGAIP
jgi:hypothetical protein